MPVASMSMYVYILLDRMEDAQRSTSNNWMCIFVLGCGEGVLFVSCTFLLTLFHSWIYCFVGSKTQDNSRNQNVSFLISCHIICLISSQWKWHRSQYTNTGLQVYWEASNCSFILQLGTKFWLSHESTSYPMIWALGVPLSVSEL